MVLLKKKFKAVKDFNYLHNLLKYFLIEMKTFRRENFVSLKFN